MKVKQSDDKSYGQAGEQAVVDFCPSSGGPVYFCWVLVYFGHTVDACG